MAELLRRRIGYCSHYGYPLREGLVAEFWWRVEHLGYYRGEDGGLFGAVRRFGYGQRKAWERRGEARRTTDPAPRASNS